MHDVDQCEETPATLHERQMMSQKNLCSHQSSAAMTTVTCTLMWQTINTTVLIQQYKNPNYCPNPLQEIE